MSAPSRKWAVARAMPLEPGRPDPRDYDGASVRVLICRLSEYGDVRQSITHRALLWAARGVGGIYADLAFRPDKPEIERRELAGEPVWRATGCGRPPRAFHILGISLNVAQEALNLPRLLRSSGVPIGHAERMADPDCPLVLVGGHSAAAASFLCGPVDPDATTGAAGGLADAVVIGDGIGAFREILGIARRLRERGASKREILAEMAGVAGVYVPALYEHVYHRSDVTALIGTRARFAGAPLPVRRRDDPPEVWRGYDGAYVPWSDVPEEETLPVAVACPWACRFCGSGWAWGPYRQMDPDLATEIALAMKANLAAADLNLLSPDIACYRGLPPLIERLLAVYPRISAKSLAGISLLGRPWLAALLPRLGKRELTIGIEGLSGRLRAYLGKRVDVGSLPRLFGDLARAGLRQSKLFYILTGLEADGDYDELDAFLAAFRAAAPRLRVLVSVMPLMPVPGTPLQFAPVPPGVESGARRVARTAAAHDFQYRVSAPPAEIRAAAMLVRAGRAATPALVRLSIEDGVLYEGGLRGRAAALVERRMRETGLDPERLLGEWPRDAPLPWDDLHLGVDRARLAAEYDRAVAALNAGATSSGSADREDLPGAPMPRRAAERVPDIPDPFRERTRLGLAFEVRPEQRDAPAATLARGALRARFRGDRAAAAAFAGLVEVAGLAGASGLRLATAEFRSDWAEADTGGRSSDPFAPWIRSPPDRPWFLARLAMDPDAAFDVVAERIAAARPAARWRSSGRAPRRRIVVERSHRGRLGVAAAWTTAGGVDLLLSVSAGRFLRDLGRRLGPDAAPLDVIAVLEIADARCPSCRGSAFRPVARARAVAELICPKCGG